MACVDKTIFYSKVKKLWNSYGLFGVFFLLGSVYYFVSKNLAFLLFNLFWQAIVGNSLISNLKTYLNTRKGPLAKGKLLSFIQEANKEFEVTVEFSWPTETHTYQIIRTVRDVRVDEEFRIWVDKSEPEESVIVKKIDSYWYVSIVGLSFVQAALLYIDYVLILRMLS